MDAATIVTRVRALSGITRKELAALARVSPSTVGRIEHGTLDPTWTTLSSILESTGFRIDGDTVASAGDPTAIAAARPVLESLLAAAVASLGGPASGTAGAAEASRPDARPDADDWRGRWTRAGWLSDRTGADDAVKVAVVAGNAGRIARRTVARRTVAAPDGWRALARRLAQEGVDYAVSGLVAAREDRATAESALPVIYVDDPVRVATALGLTDAVPGRGVQLVAPGGEELARTEIDDGIRFVSRAQGILDAFAGSGREPDKAEDVLRSLLAGTA